MKLHNQEKLKTIECLGTTEDIRINRSHNRIHLYEGQSANKQHRHVQIRLENDSKIFLSTQEGHISSLQIGEITFDELYKIIRDTTSK